MAAQSFYYLDDVMREVTTYLELMDIINLGHVDQIGRMWVQELFKRRINDQLTRFLCVKSIRSFHCLLRNTGGAMTGSTSHAVLDPASYSIDNGYLPTRTLKVMLPRDTIGAWSNFCVSAGYQEQMLTATQDMCVELSICIGLRKIFVDANVSTHLVQAILCLIIMIYRAWQSY